MIRSLARSVFVVVPLSVVLACSDDGDGAGGATTGSKRQAVVDAYVANAYRGYADSLAAAKQLKGAVDAFVAAPSPQTLEAAKSAWVAARTPYGPTEVHRFYGGPIDAEGTGPEGELNAWPLDESFIDAIVSETSFSLTAESVRSRNEERDETTIATGYHAIEFLLWGKDTEDASSGLPGSRPFTDYTTAQFADRRKQYLQIVTDLVVEDLQSMVDAWAPDRDNYAKTFAADPDALANMLKGMGSMANAELSGERMTVAYVNRSQEDEHSCFSDTTNADLLGNFVGIQNVYLGRWGSSDHPGVDEIVAEVDAALDAKTKGDMDAARVALEAMTVPFDQAIQQPDGSPGRQAILRAIQAIKVVASDIQEVAAALQIPIELEQPSETL